MAPLLNTSLLSEKSIESASQLMNEYAFFSDIPAVKELDIS